MTTRDQLSRAHPRVDGPTYQIVKGTISRGDYEKALNAERQRHGLPEIRPEQQPKQK